MERRKVLATFDGAVGGLPWLRWRSEVRYTEVDAAGEPVPLGVEQHAACPACGGDLRLGQVGADGCRLDCPACGYASQQPAASLSRFGRRLMEAAWQDADPGAGSEADRDVGSGGS